MVKAYLRYEASDRWFGVIASGQAGIDRLNTYLVVPALEKLLFYNTHACTVSSTCAPPAESKPGEITALCAVRPLQRVACGYADGSLRVFAPNRREALHSLNAHTTAITCASYSPSGSYVVTGSADTNVSVMDIISGVGVVSLRGHTAQVMGCTFVTESVLATAAKDSHIRLWDLHTEHCTQTITSHREEVHSLCLLYNGASSGAESGTPSHPRLASCSRDGSVRLFNTAHCFATTDDALSSTDLSNGQRASQPLTSLPELHEVGEAVTVARRKGSRLSVASVHLSAASGKKSKREQQQSELVDFMCVLHSDREAAIYRARSPSEAARHARRRAKRLGQEPSHAKVQAIDELVHVCTAKTSAKVRGLCIEPSVSRMKKTALSLSMTVSNNSIELYNILREENYSGVVHYSAERAATIDMAGHRSDVRACALSSDDTQLITAANGSTKVWNVRSGACLRTIECGYGLCAAFAPGNRFALVGCKEGGIDILNAEAGVPVEKIEAHSGSVWSMAFLPSGDGIVTGAADKTCKLWEWVILQQAERTQSNPGGTATAAAVAEKRLSLQLQHTLEMTDDVVSVRVTPDGKLLLAALLDCTVRAFFMDTFKPFLSFYGHKLPVLSMDISYDNMLLATGSADKDLRIWGLDFGDCHKSLFAHDDSVMAVSFVPKTHYVFTAGKDKVLRHWDADKRELLLELRGHHAEIWALTVSTAGDLVVTSGHDKSIRLWERTGEPFFLEEEKEYRLEARLEENESADTATVVGDDERVVYGENNRSEATVAGKRSTETLSAVDALLEALELASNEQKREDDDERAIQRGTLARPNARKPNPLLLGRSPNEHVLQAVGNVKPSELEQAMLVLPFASVLELLQHCTKWLQQRLDVELSCRVATHLLRLHQPQLSASASAKPVLLQLHEHLRPALKQLRDTVGTNIAAMRAMKHMKTG